MKEILETIDFIDGRVDLDSVHPNKLSRLVAEGLIDEIDPQNGEKSFYILTIKGKQLYGEKD